MKYIVMRLWRLESLGETRLEFLNNLVTERAQVKTEMGSGQMKR